MFLQEWENPFISAILLLKAVNCSLCLRLTIEMFYESRQAKKPQKVVETVGEDAKLTSNERQCYDKSLTKLEYILSACNKSARTDRKQGTLEPYRASIRGMFSFFIGEWCVLRYVRLVSGSLAVAARIK